VESRSSESTSSMQTEIISGPSSHRVRMQRKTADAGGEQDEVVKASTDKMSKVFDWIVEQSPSSSSNDSTRDAGKSGPTEAHTVSNLEGTNFRSSEEEKTSQLAAESASTTTPGSSQLGPTSAQGHPHTPPSFMPYPVTASSNQPHTLSSPPSSSSASSTSSSLSSSQPRVSPKDPQTKFDLERFYVAVCRRLYDDGF
jgi:hypothetical protein